MTLYSLKLGIRKLSRLLYYGIFYLELPYVMKHTAGCGKLDLILAHAQPLCENITYHRHIHAVGIGQIVEITHIVEHVEHTEGI